MFDQIPSKTKFLKDLDFNNSYIGFRYFLQERNPEPSIKFMEKMCSELGYDYMRIPIKSETDGHIIDKLQSDFTEDLKKYLKRYENEPQRTPTKSGNSKDNVSEAVAAFRLEQELLDSSKRLDVSDLF